MNDLIGKSPNQNPYFPCIVCYEGESLEKDAVVKLGFVFVGGDEGVGCVVFPWVHMCVIMGDTDKQNNVLQRTKAYSISERQSIDRNKRVGLWLVTFDELYINYWLMLTALCSECVRTTS